MRRRTWRHRRAGVLLAGAIGILLVLAGHAAGVLERPELATVDLRFELRGTQAAADIVVVAIDEETFSELDPTWPTSCAGPEPG